MQDIVSGAEEVEGMIVKIIFFVCMYPVNLVLYFLYRNYGRMEHMRQTRLYYGVHAPKEEDLREVFMRLVQEQEKLYMKRLKRYMLATCWIPVITFLIPGFSISFSIWMLWLVAVMGLLILPYIRAHQSLKGWKRKYVLEKDTAQAPSYTELRAAGEVRQVRMASFLAPILISIAAAVVYAFFAEKDGSWLFTIMIAVFAMCTPLFYLLAAWMDRQKVLVISEDSEVNLNYARAKKHLWKNYWVFCAWVNTALTLVFTVCLGWTGASVGWTVLGGTIVYTIVLIGMLIPLFRKLGKLEESYQDKRELQLEVDDDENWILGLIYYNKQDKHAMVESRFGIGTTMNMATTLGKVMDLIGSITILSLPIVCIWTILGEYTPLQLEVSGQVLVAEQMNADYEIPVQKIEELELITQLPELSKYSGMGSDTVCKGSFYARTQGDCEVFLNRQNEYYITFVADGMRYYMSDAVDEGTLAAYQELVQRQEGK